MKFLRKDVDKREVFLSLFVIVLIVIFTIIPSGFSVNQDANNPREKVQITKVDNSKVYSAGGVVLQGAQECEAKILTGEFAGQIVKAENLFLGKLEMDKVFSVGDEALAVVDINSKKITNVTLVDHYRLDLEFFLVLAFFLLLIIYGRWSGFKAFITFVMAVLLIWKVMVPLFLLGYSPILVAFVIIVFKTVVIIAMVAGINKKSLVAILGSLLGTLLTCILAVVFGHFFKIHGAVMPYSESLLYSGYANLNLTDIFISSIFIASSGALMDVAIDIAAAINEIVEKNPLISRKEAIKSGFNIGRSVVGTMTTTLLLAYSGGYIALLMVFMAQGTPVVNILNLKYVSKEILHTMIGSFGLVTVAPLTAILAGFIMTKKKAVDESIELVENVEAQEDIVETADAV